MILYPILKFVRVKTRSIEILKTKMTTKKVREVLRLLILTT